MNYIFEFFILSLLFTISPFLTLVISFVLLYKKNTELQTTCYLFFISLFWGILAYTQKSLAQIGTDIIRYYHACEVWENMSPLNAFLNAISETILNYVFYPVSAFLVALTGNKQIICLFWVTLTYMLSYLGIRRLMKYFGCYEQRKFTHIVLCITFCFMCFVQISELLKNASAFAVFFYGFSLFIEKGWGWRPLLFIVLAVGLHPSVFMLLPLYFYQKISSKKLIMICVISVFFGSTFNVQRLFSYLPSQWIYFQLFLERFGDSSYGIGTIHYTCILLAMFCMGILLWLKSGRKSNDICNIIFLYFIIALFNYFNLVSYLRLAFFSHFLFGMMLVQFVKLNRKKWDLTVKLLIIFMCFMTVRYSYFRTLSGDYCSSYMDNSLSKIIFSTSKDYLDIKYDKANDDL